MPAKLDRCVKEVEKQNKGKPKSKRVNPWAICKAALKKGKNKGTNKRNRKSLEK